MILGKVSVYVDFVAKADTTVSTKVPGVPTGFRFFKIRVDVITVLAPFMSLDDVLSDIDVVPVWRRFVLGT